MTCYRLAKGEMGQPRGGLTACLRSIIDRDTTRELTEVDCPRCLERLAKRKPGLVTR